MPPDGAVWPGPTPISAAAALISTGVVNGASHGGPAYGVYPGGGVEHLIGSGQPEGAEAALDVGLSDPEPADGEPLAGPHATIAMETKAATGHRLPVLRSFTWKDAPVAGRVEGTGAAAMEPAPTAGAAGLLARPSSCSHSCRESCSVRLSCQSLTTTRSSGVHRGSSVDHQLPRSVSVSVATVP
jgi:hypothetical protein